MEGRRATRVIEFFGGIGACTQALKRLGIDFEVVDYVEVDKYPVASYNAMNDTNFEPQDICQWDKDVTDIDLIMHGSPCQDFSIAGHGKGGDEGSGTRSSLMYETLRIVEKIKPRIVIWENVKGLLSPKHRHNYEAYLQRMSDMGYTNHYQVLNAKHYGIPQNRERIFTVSLLDGSADFKFPENGEITVKLKDLLESDVDSKFYLSDKMLEKITWNTKGNEIIEIANLNKGGERGPVLSSDGICSCLSATEFKQPKQIIEPKIDMVGLLDIKGNEQVRRVYAEDGLAPTLNTMGGGNRQPKLLVREATKKGYAEAVNEYTEFKIRKLTPLECWRLMGFDDEVFYKAQKVNSNTQLYKEAGNSIVVNVLYEILKQLKDCGAL